MTKKEIGSGFWDAPTIDKQNYLFPESTQWFLCGRSALIAIIKELGEARSVSLPSWCCDSIIKPFVDAGLEISLYPVYLLKGKLIQEIEVSSDVLFLMDYFGYTGSAPDLSNYKGIVIRDVTHSLFSAKYSDADYYFGSLRKWCGIWTGGYVWTEEGHKLRTEFNNDTKYVSLCEKAMQRKTEYIIGQREDKGYLKLFDEAEELLKNVGPFPASDRDIQVAKELDVETIKKRRRDNSEVLRSAFHDWLIFPEVSSDDVPMFVPVIVPEGKRNKMRQYLISKSIYCPIHWPVTCYHRLNEIDRYLYENELSLVCDQRYKEEDMYRIVETIKKFWKEV